MAVRIDRGRDTSKPEYEVTYVGRVLSLREANYPDDSDFFALVWSDEDGKPREVEYATTRGWTYNNGATIDADDETLAKYEAYLVEQNIQEALDLDRRRHATLDRDKTVTLNRTVRSKRNGTFQKGETGTIFWVGPDRYASQWAQRYSVGGPPMRAGVEFPDGRKHFFSEDDLTVQVDAATLKTEDDVRKYAEYRARETVERVRKYRKLPKGVTA